MVPWNLGYSQLKSPDTATQRSCCVGVGVGWFFERNNYFENVQIPADRRRFNPHRQT